MRTEFPGTRVVETSPIDLANGRSISCRLSIRLGCQSALIERLLEKHEVRVLSHSFFPQPQLGNKGIATIAWIPDFQHLHLPAFCPAEERDLRNRAYRNLCASCNTVIVSSDSVKADLTSFAPEYSSKAAVLRFVSRPPHIDNPPSLAGLQMKYDFDGPFFLLPNQFWAHKNHQLVISALRILKQKKHQILVLATGLTNDYRNPGFYGELMEFAKKSDVLDVFRVLGQIPSTDLASLMSHTIAIINPSRFEGWSTSVEEAKSLGKTILLSDIPVHREQAPELGRYFQADDPEGLGSILWETLNNYDPEVEKRNQQRARDNLRARLINFAESYYQVVLGAVEHEG